MLGTASSLRVIEAVLQARQLKANGRPPLNNSSAFERAWGRAGII